jgi:hypothetical protein
MMLGIDVRHRFSNFAGISPLKIRGARGVMKIIQITPSNPPYLKGETKGKTGLIQLTEA